MIARRGGLVGLCLWVLVLTGCTQTVRYIKLVTGLTPSVADSLYLMDSSDPDDVRKGIEAIVERGDSDPDLVGLEVQRLVRLLARSRSQLVRASAATTLGYLGERSLSLPALRKSLADEENRPVVLIDAIGALGQLALEPSANGETVKALQALYPRALDPGVRRAITLSLGAQGDPVAITLLLTALKDDSSQVRLGAGDGLRAITGLQFETDPKLWRDWAANREQEAELVAKWQAEQDQMAVARGSQKGGVFDDLFDTIGLIGGGIGSDISAGLHEVVLGYKRAKHSVFGSSTPVPLAPSDPQVPTDPPGPTDLPGPEPGSDP